MARILVVDDDSDTVGLVVRRLQHAGHKAQGVTNAVDALSFVTEKKCPDMAVLDVDMPDMDGLTLLGKLREQTGRADLPAIFLSGLVRPDDIAAGRSLGAIYLTKPFVATALLKAIDGIIEAEAQRAVPDVDEW
jgi:CheY-like chemotaxis protein